MRSRFSWWFLLVSLLGACGGEAASGPPVTTPASDPAAAPRDPSDAADAAAAADASPPGFRLAPDVRPSRYALTLTVDPRGEAFSGVATIDVELARATRRIVLHGQGLRVERVTLEPEGASSLEGSWQVLDEEQGVAAVRSETPVGPGRVRLSVQYAASYDESLEGLYRVEQGADRYVFTQMEPLGARKAFPCFDEPGFKTPFDVTLVVRDGDVAIANAPERSSEPAGEGLRRVRFETTEPLPTYLVALAVGPLDVVEGPTLPPSEVRDRPLRLRAVAARGQGRLLGYALEHTPRIVAALERYFGIAYPYAKLDLIAVPDFSAGAMENAGAITFRDSLLLLREDAPMRQRRGFAYVTAHELAHQWFGNLVTMAWWDDLWLNEAFATWAETRTIEETFPEHRPQIAQMASVLEAMEADSLASARQIRQPIATSHDIHNAFDGITYSKGDAVLSMFERWLGPEVFRRGVQRYLRAHAHGNARAEDFVGALGEEAGRDVSAPFTSFLEQPGLPLVAVTVRCEGDRGHLSLTQARYAPLGSSAAAAPALRPWQAPVCVRYEAGGSEHRECALLREPSEEMPLSGGCPSWVMPNADGVGYYRFALDAASLEALRRSVGRLSTREQVALADSVRASFDAGRTSFADALAALEPFARSEERLLARAPMGLYDFALDRLLEPAEAQRARRRAGALYADEARRLGLWPRASEDPDTPVRRAELLGFLANTVEDAAVRRELARLGRAYLGLGARTGRAQRSSAAQAGATAPPSGEGALHPEAVPSDLADLAVRVAVQEGGAPAYDHALGLLAASTDPIVRGRLLAALAAVRDPSLRPRAIELTLDARLRRNETLRPLMAQLDDVAGATLAWDWLRARYDAVAERVGPGYAGYLPYVATGFCDGERAAEARAFFADRVERTQGGPRNLEEAVETVTLCAARAAQARESARAVFAR
jgi:alanyl aminopeptidase